VVLARRLWPKPVMPAPADQPAAEGEDQLAGDDQGQPAGEAAETGQPATEARGADARQDGGSSLEGQPGREGPAAAGGQVPVPSPRGEPSASEKKAGSAR
jgi:hypothetical protein